MKNSNATLALDIIDTLAKIDERYAKPLKNQCYIYLAGKYSLCGWHEVIDISKDDWQKAKHIYFPELVPYHKETI